VSNALVEARTHAAMSATGLPHSATRVWLAQTRPAPVAQMAAWPLKKDWVFAVQSGPLQTVSGRARAEISVDTNEESPV
jgi:hypothetical protein